MIKYSMFNAQNGLSMGGIGILDMAIRYPITL